MENDREKVFNPRTRRYVYARGKVGKEILHHLESPATFDDIIHRSDDYELQMAMNASMEEFELNQKIEQYSTYITPEEQMDFMHMTIQQKKLLCELLPTRHREKLKRDQEIKSQQDSEYLLSVEQDSKQDEIASLIKQKECLEMQDKEIRRNYSKNTNWDEKNTQITNIRTALRDINSKLQDPSL